MNNYNSSSYYRANPYKDIGYMPPMAQKNRRSPEYTGEIPQGEQYFEPSAKKHFGYSYQNEIEGERILRGSSEMSPLQKQAMQRSYFRSLNSKDIEGSSTNTLISKAVKNKMKAQQELQRRKQIQKQQAEAEKLHQYEQQQKRKKYIQDYHRQVMQERSQTNPNQSPGRPENKQISNELDEKHRRQTQLLKLAQQRKNYAIVDFPQLYNNQESRGINNNSAIVQSQPNFHQLEIEKRRKTERSNQKQLEQDDKHGYPYGEPKYEENALRKEQQNPYYKDSLENVKNKDFSMPNRPSYSPYEYQNQNPYQEKLQPRDHYQNDYHKIEKDEIRKYEDYRLPYENINPVTQIQKKQDSKQKFTQEDPLFKQEYPRKQSGNSLEAKSDKKIPQGYPSANTNPYTPMYGSPQPFKNREDLRRHNPTFLSYGSPTFALASRNVIGN